MCGYHACSTCIDCTIDYHPSDITAFVYSFTLLPKISKLKTASVNPAASKMLQPLSYFSRGKLSVHNIDNVFTKGYYQLHLHPQNWLTSFLAFIWAQI